MSLKKSIINNVLNDPIKRERDEEWVNFEKRIGEVSNIVRDLSSGDKATAEAAKVLADQYLDGKVILDEDVKLTVKSDRTVINQKAFKAIGRKDTGEMDKNVWMSEVSKDADKRAHDRKVRQERSDTYKTMATKAFRRGDYERALTCYNKAIEQIKDNTVLYTDRALTNIKLKRFDKVFDDCYWALRLNENSFKARLYQAKAHKELENFEDLEKCRKELDAMFPQHNDLITFFLDKKEEIYGDDESQGDTIII